MRFFLYLVGRALRGLVEGVLGVIGAVTILPILLLVIPLVEWVLDEKARYEEKRRPPL
jgi:uncharacterized membrane protein YfcA